MFEKINLASKVAMSRKWTNFIPLEVSSRADIVATTVEGTIKVGDAWLPAGDCTDLDHSPLDRETFDSVKLCLTVTDLSTDIQQPVQVTKDESNLYTFFDPR